VVARRSWRTTGRQAEESDEASVRSPPGCGHVRVLPALSPRHKRRLQVLQRSSRCIGPRPTCVEAKPGERHKRGGHIRQVDRVADSTKRLTMSGLNGRAVRGFCPDPRAVHHGLMEQEPRSPAGDRGQRCDPPLLRSDSRPLTSCCGRHSRFDPGCPTVLTCASAAHRRGQRL